MLNNIDMRLLQQQVEENKSEIAHLKEIIKQQQQMLDVLWIAPGMPGTFEAQERFENNTK